MHFPTKKMGVNFSSKKYQTEGSEGVWQKTTLFPDFFLQPFLILVIIRAKAKFGLSIFNLNLQALLSCLPPSENTLKERS